MKEQIKATQPKKDEMILVVKRTDLFKDETAWSGIKKVDFDEYLQIIHEKKEFLPRSLMECDPHYKQIIPYLVFEHNGHYFLMQRTSHTTEQRLANKFSLGIGGHIRQEDMESNSLFDWAKREFQEEVAYDGNVAVEPLGMLNDDSDDVGKVHLGFVFLLKGDSPNITIKSELKSGTLLSLDELKGMFDSMESWSKLVFEFLIARK